MALLSGSEIFATLSDNLAQREAAILNYVQNGNFTICWTPLTVSYGPYTATFMVSADSLRLGTMGDSFRVAATAALYQKIADELGAAILTAKLHDEVYKQSKYKLTPTTMSATAADIAAMGTMAVMKRASDAVDAKIAVATGLPIAAIAPLLYSGCLFVSNEGKFWVNSTYVSNQGPVQAWGHPPQPGTFASENYGFYEPQSAGTIPTVTGIPGVGVIQGPGHAHDYGHSDYSQGVRLVQRNVRVCKGFDCRDVDIYDLGRDPNLAGLVNHDRVAINMRYPRVPWSPSTAAVALWGKPGTVGDTPSSSAALTGGFATAMAQGASSASGTVANTPPPPLLPPDTATIAAVQGGFAPPQNPFAQPSVAFDGPGLLGGLAMAAVGAGIGWFGWQAIG